MKGSKGKGKEKEREGWRKKSAVAFTTMLYIHSIYLPDLIIYSIYNKVQSFGRYVCVARLIARESISRAGDYEKQNKHARKELCVRETGVSAIGTRLANDGETRNPECAMQNFTTVALGYGAI